MYVCVYVYVGMYVFTILQMSSRNSIQRSA